MTPGPSQDAARTIDDSKTAECRQSAARLQTNTTDRAAKTSHRPLITRSLLASTSTSAARPLPLGNAYSYKLIRKSEERNPLRSLFPLHPYQHHHHHDHRHPTMSLSDCIMRDATPPPSATRRFTPTPVETTVKKVRRFAVEPVETTTRSNRREEVQKVEDSATVEEKKLVDPPTKRRFIPEPVDTTLGMSTQPLPTPEATPVSVPEISLLQEPPKPRRKFVPELIETLKRSKRAGDGRPATLPTDKVNSSFRFTIYRALANLSSHGRLI